MGPGGESEVAQSESEHSEKVATSEVVESVVGKGSEAGSEASLAFYALESHIFDEVKEKLHCRTCCAKGSLVKNGGAGTVAANGVQRMQLKCVKCKQGTRYSKEQLHLALKRGNFDSEHLEKKLREAYEALPVVKGTTRGGRATKTSGTKGETVHSKGFKRWEEEVKATESPLRNEGMEVEEPKDGVKRKRVVEKESGNSTGIVSKAKKCREAIEEEDLEMEVEEWGDEEEEQDKVDAEKVKDVVQAGDSAVRIDFEAVDSVDTLLSIPNAVESLLKAYKEQCQVIVDLSDEKEQMVLRLDRMKDEFQREKERAQNEALQMKVMMMSLQKQMSSLMKGEKSVEAYGKRVDNKEEAESVVNDDIFVSKTFSSVGPAQKNGRGDAQNFSTTFLRKIDVQRAISPQPVGIGSSEREGVKVRESTKRVHFQPKRGGVGQDTQVPGSMEEADINGDKDTYVRVAKEGRWRQDRLRDVQMAAEFSQPRSKPQSWHRILIKWNPSRKIKEEGRKSMLYFAWRFLENAKINFKVKDISLRGNSCVEIYVAGVCYEEVVQALKEKKYEFSVDVPKEEEEDLSQIRVQVINRLAGMVYRNSLIVNLRECILAGFDSIREEILIRASELEKKFGPREKAGRR